MNEEYWNEFLYEVYEALMDECTEIDPSMEEEGILIVNFEDEWWETDVPVEQLDVDDFKEEDLLCSCKASLSYDLWHYMFLSDFETLIKDIIYDIAGEKEKAIEEAIEEYHRTHDRHGYEIDEDREYEAWKDTQMDRD